MSFDVRASKITDFINAAENGEKIYPGDYVQVIDNKTQKVVIQGQIRKDKRTWCPLNNHDRTTFELNDEEILFSVDDKYFFKLDDDRYIVRKLPQRYVDEAFLRQHYAMQNWNRYTEATRKDFNMYVDHDIDELDDEVVGIVHVLNKFSMDMKTVVSCCGHGKEQPWITIQFNSSRALEDFLNVFQPFKEKMRLTTSRKNDVPREIFLGNPYFPYCMVLVLRTKEVGDEGYKVLDEFAIYLEKIIDVRNNAFKQLDEIIEQEETI